MRLSILPERSFARCVAPTLLACALSLTCALARADDLHLTLSYTAPPGCPSVDWLRGEVRRLATRQTQPYAATVGISREQEQFRARIVARDGSERTLVGGTCEEVAEATAVVLALAISPSGTQPEAMPNRVRADEASPRPAPTRSGRSNDGAPVRLGVSAAATLDVGTVPSADIGASARVGLTAPSWSAGLEGVYFLLPEHQTLAQRPDVRATFSWWTLLADGCLAAKRVSPRIELCAGPELGRLSGHGEGVTYGKNAGTFRLGLQALAQLHLPISAAWQLRAGLGTAAVLLGRRWFQIDGQNVYRPPVLSARATLGAEFVF